MPTFVFDEVDAGVGGQAAVEVGARLAALARTPRWSSSPTSPRWRPSPTGTSWSRKSDDGHVTRSGVHALDGEERVRELARMLAGVAGRRRRACEHARELLDHGRV